MTISTSTNRITFNGNGATTDFSFTFKVFTSEDVEVYTNDGTTETQLAVGSGYSITINTDQTGSPGGTVTISPAINTGTTVTIIRVIAATQETDLVNGGAFYAETIENALDKVTMLAQQAQERADRALAIAVTSTEDPDVVLTDLLALGDSAAASASAAATSASSAATSATLAAQSFIDTSASTVAIGTGSKSWTVSTGKNFRAGQFVTVSDAADTANYCYGTVTSYTSGTGALVVNVTTTGGSGTKSSWNVSLSGERGATSATGAAGDAGPAGVNWLGAWNSGTAYEIADAVSYLSQSYICTVAHTNHAPTDVAYWDLLAAKGSDGAGSGTVTNVSVNTANGLAGTVSTATSTPAISLSTTVTGMLKGNGTAISAASAGTDYCTPSSSETLTNKTISASSNTVSGFGLTGKHTIWIPATAMTTRTTNGAASGTVESTTNKIMVKTLDYDAATAEYAQCQIRMPKSWDESTVTAYFVWSNASGTGNVVWGVQAVALSDDDVIDAAFGTAQTVTDGVTAAEDLMQSAETSAITIAGTPAANDLVVFQFYRDAASGSDTLAVDARLHGVTIIYSTDAGNDA